MISLKTFTTTGVCTKENNYMVDISDRLVKMKAMIDSGNYFTINRARQYGKTTTLHALADYLKEDYFVISMDFQMQMSNAKFRNENVFSLVR